MQHQRARPEAAANAARGVGHDEDRTPSAPKTRTGRAARARRALVQMEAAALHDHLNATEAAGHQLALVPLAPSAREIRECPRTECAPRRSTRSASPPSPVPRMMATVGVRPASAAGRPAAASTLALTPARPARHRRIPAIAADMKFAMVPASIARKPEAGEVGLALGHERPDAADLDADRGDVGEPRQRERGDGERARIERRLHRVRAARRR